MTRPKTRGDCLEGGTNAARPCPFASCRYNLIADPVTRGVKVTWPESEIDAATETCALDVADRGGVTHERVGEMMRITRQGVQLIEKKAMRNLARRSSALGLDLRAFVFAAARGYESCIEEIFSVDFCTAVDRAYRRIVPASLRGRHAIEAHRGFRRRRSA